METLSDGADIQLSFPQAQAALASAWAVLIQEVIRLNTKTQNASDSKTGGGS